MLSHTNLVDFVRRVLSRSGYWVSEPSDVRPACFDVAARRDGELILVKTLVNIDALPRAVAEELRLVSRLLDARALVVGGKSGTREVEEGLEAGVEKQPAAVGSKSLGGVGPGESGRQTQHRGVNQANGQITGSRSSLCHPALEESGGLDKVHAVFERGNEAGDCLGVIFVIAVDGDYPVISLVQREGVAAAQLGTQLAGSRLDQ